MVPDGISLLIVIAAIALTAGFVHSAIGFGFGIVAIALLPLFVDVRQSHVVISTASVPVLLMATWSYRQGADLRSLLHACVGAAIALPLGLLAFYYVSIDLLVRGTGAAILGMIWLNHRNRKWDQGSNPKGLLQSPAIAGGVSGFLAGAVSIAGPPIAAFALGMGWTQERFKAFVNQFLLVVSIYKVVGLYVGGYLDREALTQAMMLAPAAVVGIWLGAIASKRLSAKRFESFVLVTLIVIAVYFIAAGR